MVELVVSVDTGEPFVKVTYKLEGDGALAHECYAQSKQLVIYETQLLCQKD